MKKFLKALPAVVFVMAAALATSSRAQVPLVAWWNMAPDAARPNVLVDRGPLKQNGDISGAKLVRDPQRGDVLAVDGAEQFVTVKGEKANAVRVNFSVTCWINIDRPGPKDKSVFIVRKGDNVGWQLAMSGTHAFIHGNWGGDWYQAGSGGKGVVPIHQWVHYAMTFQKGDRWRIYINGKEAVAAASPFAIWPVDLPLKIGGSDWAGKLSDVRIYAAALTAEQIQQDMNNALSVRPATDADFPKSGYPVHMALGRYDMPFAFSGFCFRCKQTAERVPGPDAVDWPTFHLSDGTKLFEKSAKEVHEIELESGAKSMSLFPRADDLRIEPVGLWLRGVKWRWGMNVIYTSDLTARSWTGDYEMWVFPVKISGTSSGQIHNVSLKLKGEEIYRHSEQLNSLTLLVPANPSGEPYELAINDLPAVKFDAGIKPIEFGNPNYVPITGDYSPSSQIHVVVNGPSETFPHQKEWDADVAAMKETARTLHEAEATTQPSGMGLTGGTTKVFTIEMSAGMSGGHLFSSAHGPGFKGSPENYARFLAGVGYDFDIESINVNTLRKREADYDKWFAALGDAHVAGLLNVEGFSHESMLGGPNIAFYAATLPEWRRPLYREYQLIAQRFSMYPNFAGIFTGADNAGYVPYWDWAPPIPNRPWARALSVAMDARNPSVPVAKSDGTNKDYERDAKNYAEFLRFVDRYDQTWKSYSYFAGAVGRVNPALAFTLGSFGSSPGVGGRGGWAWASVPCGPIFNGLPVQTAYDWNEVSSYKPMHNVALVDRLRSTDPEKPTWSIIDEFGLFACREARQRAYALVLTRGLQAVGTNFLAHTTAGNTEHFQSIIDAQKELYSWIHRYGGMYAQMKPLATVGIVYVHQQALGRRGDGSKDPSDDALYHGDHEGKTTEALFMCHAAGIPARIVTPEELLRGNLDVKALLLVGLNRFDSSWVWYQGLEKPLQDFVAHGGRIIADDESESPVDATKPPLRIAAYITQSSTDQAPLLLDRNRDSITHLREAIKDVSLPIARSEEPTIWAVPSLAGDWQFLTVVNWGYDPNQNADQFVKGQTGKLIWSTDRQIYDVRAKKILTAAEATTVDLTHDGFQLYALPPKQMTAEQIEAALTAKPQAAETQPTHYAGLPMDELWKPSKRPLVLALTPQQASDPVIMAIAKRVQSVASTHGRNAAIRQIAPGDVVVSLQPQEAIFRYPQWATIDADLILMGSIDDNILLMDQARGGLLPRGQNVCVTGSPFVGEQVVLNLLGANPTELTDCVRSLENGDAR